MGIFYDSVPVSAIVRIRDMMYTVKDPFRLDQGDVSFDAPDTFKQAVAKAMADNRTHYLPTPGIPRAAQGVRREDADQEPHPGRVTTMRCVVTNGGTHGIYAVLHALLEPGDEVIVPGPGMAADHGDRPGGAGRAGAGAVARGLGFRWDIDEVGTRDHAEDARPLPELAEQPERRHPDARRHRAPRRDRQGAQPVGGVGRSVRRRALQRRARQHRVAARHVRAARFRSTR